jgi:hydroxyethylthiazole kinase-like uncharacterized protein yjeF
VRDAYQVAKVRAAEAALMALLPDGTLMQRAAAGLAAVCAGLLRDSAGGVYGARVVILAGTGDNAGDALYAGERLARRGAAVTAIQAGQRIHADGAAALTAAGGRIIPVELGPGLDNTRIDAALAPRPARLDASHAARHAIGHADLIIDGLLGIGGTGGLREPMATLAHLADTAKNATVVAVDLPSGIDADTGAVDGPAVKADVTVTFGAVKPGLLVDPGAGYAGVVEFIDIGLAPHLDKTPDVSAPQAADIAAMLPRPTAQSDKYRRGVLGLLAGSDQYTGAAVLAAGGAVHGGAGMVRLVTAPSAAAVVRREHPEVVITELAHEAPEGYAGFRARQDSPRFAASGQRPPEDPHPHPPVSSSSEPNFPASVGRVQAWVAGPGMGTGEAAARRLHEVLKTALPVLIDADGLTILAANKDWLPRAAPTLLTPHAGELGRLLGVHPADVEARRLACARHAAAEFGACVLLKGSTTVIAPPGGLDPVLVGTTGTPWLATAGTGDVLSGLAGALLAQGLLPPQAALAAAYLHGLAARLAAAGWGAGAGRGRAVGEGNGGMAPISAADVVSALPQAFRTVADKAIA